MEQNLTNTEKSRIINNVLVSKPKDYLPEKTNLNTIKNVGNYLAESFDMLDGFDYRWSSLITSKPLLFEDTDYLRVLDYVNNTVTEEEIEAYKRGDLKDLYATFENMLMCNIHSYNRIMNFCTMIFFRYIRLDDNDSTIYKDDLDDIISFLEMTPTQICCAALTSNKSTKWEIEYGWGIKNIVETDEIIKDNWNKLISNNNFKKFVGYSSFRVEGNTDASFRHVLLNDKISDLKLTNICQKLTKSNAVFTDYQLETILNYSNEIENISYQLYLVLYDALMEMFDGNEDMFSIFVYLDQFRIHTSKFIYCIKKDENGKLHKHYEANMYECFLAEKYLVTTAKMQIKWAKYVIPDKYKNEQSILISLLYTMLKNNYKEIVGFKRMNEYGIISKIKFKGCWNKIKMIETFYVNNNEIYSQQKTLNHYNMSKYLIERGYYIFGLETDIDKLVCQENILQMLPAHYKNYCLPINTYLHEIITAHFISKNEIINILINDGNIAESKLNNHNIKYTTIKNFTNPKTLLSKKYSKLNIKNITYNSGTYWSTITK